MSHHFWWEVPSVLESSQVRSFLQRKKEKKKKKKEEGEGKDDEEKEEEKEQEGTSNKKSEKKPPKTQVICGATFLSKKYNISIIHF